MGCYDASRWHGRVVAVMPELHKIARDVPQPAPVGDREAGVSPVKWS